jgi:hypothetical protein
VSAWRRAHPDALIIVKDNDASRAGIDPAACAERRSFVLHFKTYHVLHGCPG